MRRAGALTTLEGVVAVTVAVVLVIRQLMGGRSDVVTGYGTALWFGVIGAAVGAGGLALMRGRRGGRAPAVIAQVLLVPVAWSLLVDSGQPLLGAVLAVVVVATLILLFAPASVRWMNEQYRRPERPPGPGG